MHTVNSILSSAYQRGVHETERIWSFFQGRRISDLTFLPTPSWSKVKAAALILLLASAPTIQAWDAPVCRGQICEVKDAEPGLVGLFYGRLQVSHPLLKPYLKIDALTGHYGRYIETGRPITIDDDFPRDSRDLLDFHATSIAGVVLAQKNLQLVPLSFTCYGDYKCTPEEQKQLMVRLFGYARSRSVDVLILPTAILEGDISCEDFEAYSQFGGIVVASAGNDGKPVEAVMLFPQNVASKNTLLVGTVDPEGQIESASNYGKKVMFFVNPYYRHTVATPCFIGKTACTYEKGKDERNFGTAVSAAILGRTVARMRRIDSNLNIEEIKHVLKLTGKPLPKQKRAVGQKGYIIDEEKAVAYTANTMRHRRYTS